MPKENHQNAADGDDAIAKSLADFDSTLDSNLEHGSTASGSFRAPPDAPQGAARGMEALRVMATLRASAPDRLQDILGDFARDGNDEAFDGPLEIGRFQIIRRLGSGGYGVVFLADDPILKRRVALKVPRPEALVTPGLRRRFLREAEAAAALNHPNIVPIFESGTAGPICYIASAYCEGASLAEWMVDRDTPLEPEQVARVVAQLADAVEHAHGRGVLHRDIKPSNVLLKEDHAYHAGERDDDRAAPCSTDTAVDAATIPQLTDFGLARLDDGGGNETRSTAILGTPAYMAPEQAAGDQRNVGPAADVYGLGATLYHLLAGQPPLKRDSDIETLLAIQNEDPPPPSRWNPAVPRDLDAICLKCLEKDPARRFASAAALGNDLHRFTEGLPVRARSIGRLARVARWRRRNPALAAMSALAALLFVVGLANVLWQWRRAERNLVESNRQRVRAEKNLHAAQEAVDELLTDVSHNLRDIPQMDALRHSLLLKAAKFNEQFLSDEVSDASHLLETVRAWGRAADIFQRLGDVDRWEEAVNKAIALGAAPTEGSKSNAFEFEHAKAIRRRGDFHSARNQLVAAEEDYRAALAHAEKLVDSEVPETISGLSELNRSLGILLERMGRNEEAGACFQLAVENLEPLKNLDHAPAETRFQLSKAHNSLGIHFKKNGREADALEQYRLSADEVQPLIDDDPSVALYRESFAATQINIGNLLFGMGRFEEADAAYGAAREKFNRLAEDFPLALKYKVNLSRAYVGIGIAKKNLRQFDLAAGAYLNAMQVSEELVARRPDDRVIRFSFANCLMNYGNVLRAAGRNAESEPVIVRSIAVLDALVRDFPVEFDQQNLLATAHHNLAALRSSEDDSDGAIQAIERAIDVRSSVVRALPHDARAARMLAEDYQLLAIEQARHGALDAAIAATDRIVASDPESWWTDHLAAAAWIAIAGAQRDAIAAGEHDADAEPTPDACVESALDCLRLSVTHGATHRKPFDENNAFDPLRDSQAFQDILANLDDK